MGYCATVWVMVKLDLVQDMFLVSKHVASHS